jgi:hypothetical protein
VDEGAQRVWQDDGGRWHVEGYSARDAIKIFNVLFSAVGRAAAGSKVDHQGRALNAVVDLGRVGPPRDYDG